MLRLFKCCGSQTACPHRQLGDEGGGSTVHHINNLFRLFKDPINKVHEQDTHSRTQKEKKIAYWWLMYEFPPPPAKNPPKKPPCLEVAIHIQMNSVEIVRNYSRFGLSEYILLTCTVSCCCPPPLIFFFSWKGDCLSFEFFFN